MKVLWFTNIPMPPLRKKMGLASGGSGYWMYAMLKHLKEYENLNLSVACVYPSRFGFEETIEGIDYYLIKQKKKRFLNNNELRYLDKCLDIIQKIKPDVIHVHGTERFYGLLCNYVSTIPVIISLQGLIGPYSEWFNYYGKIPFNSIVRMENLKGLVGGYSPFCGLMNFRKLVSQEIDIIRYNKIFLGRTDWDRSYINAYNPDANYYHISRIIRPEFWQKIWELQNAQKHRIFINNCRGTRSGADVMIRSLEIVRKYFPETKLYIAGIKALGTKGYNGFLAKLVKPLRDSIHFTGYLGPDEISEELCKANVSVHSSYIDNSPNSLAEAQIVGVPIIASCTGGKMAMVEHKKTGLLFPNGDHYLLADRIMQVFKSDTLAAQLSENEISIARQRHDPEMVIKKLICVYEDVQRG